ncbi:hypothetical protein DP43_5795 [Burkholderia pseudomallei]|nr:hypothetical protein DP43_5795 [Burkholderia pseudomallei]
MHGRSVLDDACAHAVDELRVALGERPVGPLRGARVQARMACDDPPRQRKRAWRAGGRRRAFVGERFLRVDRERDRAVLDVQRRDGDRARQAGAGSIGRRRGRGCRGAARRRRDGQAVRVRAGLADGGLLLERIDRLAVAYHLDLPIDHGLRRALRMRGAGKRAREAGFKHEFSGAGGPGGGTGEHLALKRNHRTSDRAGLCSV